MISVFDIFKIGIGPSSSHTVGPMKAGKQFVDDLVEKHLLTSVTRIAVEVYGSFALSRKGRHTDQAIILGLADNIPDTVAIDSTPAFLHDVAQRQRLTLGGTPHEVDFAREEAMVFHHINLAWHENGLCIHAYAGDRCVYSQTYYSIGGGFIVEEAQFSQVVVNEVNVPFRFTSAQKLLEHCRDTALSISGLVLRNELTLHERVEIDRYFTAVWQTMCACIDRGMNTEGVLPGSLRVPRRAAALRRTLIAGDKHSTDPMQAVDLVNMFALAVNEENAAGGRIVTAQLMAPAGSCPPLWPIMTISSSRYLAAVFHCQRCNWYLVQDECLHFRR